MNNFVPYLAIPKPAKALCRGDIARKGAVMDLCEQADELQWGPFRVSERDLEARWGQSRRWVRDLLRDLVEAGVLVILEEGSSHRKQLLQVARPGEQFEGADRGLYRIPHRIPHHTSSMNPGASADSVPHTEPQPPPSPDRFTQARGEDLPPRSEIDLGSESNQNESIQSENAPYSPPPGEAASVPDPVQPDPVPVPEAPSPKPARTPDPATGGGRQVWAAYLAHHPAAGDPGADGKRHPVPEDWKRLLGAVRRWGADDVTLLLAWAHLAVDDRRWPGAAWLRGDVEGSTGYLSVEDLLRPSKWAKRIGAARAWDAAGRPTIGTSPSGAPEARASPRRPRRLSSAELFTLPEDRPEPITLDAEWRRSDERGPESTGDRAGRDAGVPSIHPGSAAAAGALEPCGRYRL